MHFIQEKLLHLISERPVKPNLRKIGKLLGVEHPQQIKHHLNQLVKKGLITIDKNTGLYNAVKKGPLKNTNLISIPILGSANCGEAMVFADEYVQGYLKISKKLFNNNHNKVFAIEAVGSSMNRANINGKSIEEGDYVLIDSEYKSPRNGDYVLSVIDGMANVKKITIDKENNRVILMSESKSNFPPIFIHKNELENYIINGKVIDVLKKPDMDVAQD